MLHAPSLWKFFRLQWKFHLSQVFVFITIYYMNIWKYKEFIQCKIYSKFLATWNMWNWIERMRSRFFVLFSIGIANGFTFFFSYRIKIWFVNGKHCRSFCRAHWLYCIRLAFHYKIESMCVLTGKCLLNRMYEEKEYIHVECTL